MTPEVSKAAYEAMKRPPFDSMDVVERGFVADYLSAAATAAAVADRVKEFEGGKRPAGFPAPVPPAPTAPTK